MAYMGVAAAEVASSGCMLKVALLRSASGVWPLREECPWQAHVWLKHSEW